jgi:hypothetical protein
MSVTYYAVLPFVRDEDGNPVPGEAREMQDSAKASRWATIMAADPGNCGAVAYSRTGDPALGDWHDAVIVKSVGEVGELPTG